MKNWKQSSNVISENIYCLTTVLGDYSIVENAVNSRKVQLGFSRYEGILFDENDNEIFEWRADSLEDAKKQALDHYSKHLN